jgi:hypothetical protein
MVRSAPQDGVGGAAQAKPFDAEVALMAQDDGLRRLFRQHLPMVHWISCETGLTDPGVPDLNGCHQGVEFWIECKATKGWAVTLRPEQIGWLERRCRVGGRTFIAVRRRCSAGTRRRAADEVWLYWGVHARRLKLLGLKGCAPLAVFSSGPANWDWERLGIILLGQRLKK